MVQGTLALFIGKDAGELEAGQAVVQEAGLLVFIADDQYRAFRCLLENPGLLLGIANLIALVAKPQARKQHGYLRAGRWIIHAVKLQNGLRVGFDHFRRPERPGKRGAGLFQ